MWYDCHLLITVFVNFVNVIEALPCLGEGAEGMDDNEEDGMSIRRVQWDVLRAR